MSGEREELRRFEVFINTHTSSVTIEATDAEAALEEGVESLRQIREADLERDNLSVTEVTS